MSRRETVLCDYQISNWGDKPVICQKLSVGTCALCSIDMCTEHAMHPKGGIIFRADSVSPGSAANSNLDIIYTPHSNQQIQPYPQINMVSPALRLMICNGCRSQLQDHDISESLRAVEKMFVQCLAAAITAKALEEKKK